MSYNKKRKSQRRKHGKKGKGRRINTYTMQRGGGRL